MQRSGADKAGSAVRYVVLIGGALLFLLPFYLLVRNGLSTEQDITSPSWKFFPSSLQWGNIGELFRDPAVPMARSLVNSLVIAVVQTAGVLVISGLAGYGLARIPFRYANAVFYFIVATLLIPAAVTFVPSFVLVSTLGWVSTLRGLIVPGLFQAFATFLFRQYFLGFPRELEEAAQLDGTGYWGTFWRVVVPNSMGFIAAIGTITFIGSWNAFLWPLVIAPDQNAWTVQIALSTFLTAQTINLPQLFIAAAIAILPLVVIFIFLQRWIVQGVERSGISE
ncbi:multiple sugar transport system permease protein [Kribbella antiqua]|uniref:Multiple sugar transport system permease protein n=1 Tax=Kribbella antiqua TaxID=2512217 RepID=A0A4R2IP56_9ACTN|nr:carbohydrate ABC transporter permease [Kribbella antiqua]TCO47071.1 multiple sugar transport system permease protein [Kribbella antiqua]